jgi:hypothetical protein
MIRQRTTVDLSTAVSFREKELSELNAKADALSNRDASHWGEAVDWGVPDCATLCPSEWRMTTAPDFD